MKNAHKNSILLGGILLLVLGLGAFFLRKSGGLGSLSRLAGTSQAASVYGAFVQSSNFAVLAGSTVTNTGPSVVTGDLGLSPGTSITGFFGTVENDGPGTVSGSIHQTDAGAASGQIALAGAYTAASGETCSHDLTGQDLGGMTLTPGIYCFSSSAELTGTLTLNALGDPNAVFVFQIGSAFTTASSASVVFAGSIGSSCNVFWQVGTSATLGSTTTFVGNILALSAISTGDASTVNGRLLARNDAVTLINTAVIAPICSAPAVSTLHVIKLVVGGSAGASDFSIHVKNAGSEVGGGPFPGAGGLGTLYTLNQGSLYVVSEDANAAYTQSFIGCDPGGTITLAAGDNICTIINTAVVIPPPAPVRRSGGHSFLPVLATPLIGILKVPTPLALPNGPGSVAYDYTVWNVGGQESLIDVTVVDDTCASVTFVSGDANSNAKLDPAERWNYRCVMNLSATTTNTVVATGYGDNIYHQAAIATAVATVAVGTSVSPPLIAIVKVPSRLTPFPAGGGMVTYTYTVTNPGIVPLHDVSLSDDKCPSLSAPLGDADKDGMLDTGETWTYTCTMLVSTSTRNIATVVGKANGFTAIGYAFATVFVSAPGFPNTGASPLSAANPSSDPASSDSSRLRIPKIGLDAPIDSMNVTTDGSMEAPKGPATVGWFSFGPHPGGIGSAVIAGHFGFWKNGQKSAFTDIGMLDVGDEIYVTDPQGKVTAFVVRKVRTYDASADTSIVFGSGDGKSHLNLITCQGEWDEASKSYSSRLVVFADRE